MNELNVNNKKLNFLIKDIDFFEHLIYNKSIKSNTKTISYAGEL